MIDRFCVGDLVRLTFTDEGVQPGQSVEAKVRCIVVSTGGFQEVHLDIPDLCVWQNDGNTLLAFNSANSWSNGELGGDFWENSSCRGDGEFGGGFKATLEKLEES